MKNLSILILLLVILSINFNPNMKAQNLTQPKAKKIPVVDTLHNFIFTDYYRWLEDKNNPETLEWSHKSHNYTVEYIKTHYPVVVGLKEEITKYLDRDYRSAPFFKAGREFFWARKRGEQQNKLYTVLKGKEKLIFDPMAFDSSGKSSPVGPVLTDDASRAAIGLQYKGNEIYTYRIIDTKSGKVLGEPIENIYSFNWTKDEKAAYITLRSKEIIEKQVPLPTYLHKIVDGNNLKTMYF